MDYHWAPGNKAQLTEKNLQVQIPAKPSAGSQSIQLLWLPLRTENPLLAFTVNGTWHFKSLKYSVIPWETQSSQPS